MHPCGLKRLFSLKNNPNITDPKLLINSVPSNADPSGTQVLIPGINTLDWLLTTSVVQNNVKICKINLNHEADHLLSIYTGAIHFKQTLQTLTAHKTERKRKPPKNKTHSKDELLAPFHRGCPRKLKTSPGSCLSATFIISKLFTAKWLKERAFERISARGSGLAASAAQRQRISTCTPALGNR